MTPTSIDTGSKCAVAKAKRLVEQAANLGPLSQETAPLLQIVRQMADLLAAVTETMRKQGMEINRLKYAGEC
jgi:hypothetical protein